VSDLVTLALQLREEIRELRHRLDAQEEPISYVREIQGAVSALAKGFTDAERRLRAVELLASSAAQQIEYAREVEMRRYLELLLDYIGKVRKIQEWAAQESRPLSVRQIAHKFGITRGTVTRLVREGVLVRVPGSKRYAQFEADPIKVLAHMVMKLEAESSKST
jgi:CRP-like cAMP-binding protein